METCKWVLWTTCWLASEESGIPEASRKVFKESAEKIKSNPALKEIFNYEDIDKKLAILCMKEELENLRAGKSNSYTCGIWALDANWYAYFKTKEDGFRKVASLWGYEFYEFLTEIKNCCFSAVGGMCPIGTWFYRNQTPVIPPGATVRVVSKEWEPGKDTAHDQISLGEFGYSSNGIFVPGGDVLKIWGKETESFSWYYPCATEYFNDPFIYLLDCYMSGIKNIKFIHKKTSAPR